MINKRVAASFQLIILLISMFAFSYIVYSSSVVSGANFPSVCCEKTDEGAFCINKEPGECDEGFKTSPTSCESTSYCKLGTCYDSRSGICMENTPQRVCAEEGGTWADKKMEEVPQCQLGCCVIADQAAFVSLVRCKRLSTLFGVDNDYRTDVTNEVDCIATAQAQDVGACVYESDFERTCDFTTRKDCGAGNVVETVNGTNVSLSSEKKFYKDYLCSAEDLNTVCARQVDTGCYQGDVHWYDSCGNRENVYSSDLDKSWHNGRVFDADDICGKNNGGNVNCGNCDYLLGSRCSEFGGIVGGPSEGDYYCKKTECRDDNGELRKNGESWCTYDASVGLGTDPVGSRHFKEVCVDGEVRVEACADFRQEACIEGEIETDEGGFLTAACRVNRWQDCLAQTDEDDCDNLDRRDCYWAGAVSGLMVGNSNVGAPFVGNDAKTFVGSSDSGSGGVITGNAVFGGGDDDDEDDEETRTNRPGGVCVSDVPVGLKFWEEGEASSMCANANAKCIVVYEETKIGGKKCIEGCECLEDDWALAANQVCSSLGDCGGYVNYKGVFTDDGYVWKQDGEDKEFSPNDINKIVSSGKEKGSKSKGLRFSYVAGGLAGVGLVGGLLGDKISKGASSLLLPGGKDAVVGGGIFGSIGDAAGKGVSGSLSSIPKAIGMNKNWLARGAWNSLIVGAIVWGGARLLGQDKNTAEALGSATSLGLFAGDIAGQLASKAGEGSWLAGNVGLVNLGVTIAVAILVYYLTKKDIDTEVVEFNCMPWQAPVGGSSCEKCNDPDLPCSEYRCKSLGQNCELVNKGSDDEKCVNINPRDVNPPVISPNEEKLTNEYSYTNVQPNPPNAGFEIVKDEGDDGCVQAFTSLKFGVDTDEPAQCKIDIEHKSEFDEMGYWFGGSNLYLYEHVEQMALPGSDQFGNTSIELEHGNEMTLFIRCKDRNGNENSAEYAARFCVDDGPDGTAPQVRATSINNNGCIASDSESANVDFYISEPSECRWDVDDKSYESMTNTMSCSSELYQVNSLQLYTCSDELTGIGRDGQTVYVRCKDQPGKIDADRNVNQESYEFSLRSGTGLRMSGLKPDETIWGSIDPFPVELRVETALGCDNGKAVCYYSTTGNDNDYVMFYDTNNEDGIHTQRQDLTEGDYDYFVKCVDSGGNVATNKTEFHVDIDLNAPVVARVYEEDGMLKIVTVREGECSYDFNNCDFAFEEGTEMPYANSTNHVVAWQEDKTYHIKCRDDFREEADCSVIVRSVENFL